MRISDWSSDVCSSDLLHHQRAGLRGLLARGHGAGGGAAASGRIRALPRRALHRGVRPADRWRVRCVPDQGRERIPCLRGQPADPRQRLTVGVAPWARSEEHTSELQSLMRISYAVFCLKKKKQADKNKQTITQDIIKT